MRLERRLKMLIQPQPTLRRLKSAKGGKKRSILQRSWIFQAAVRALWTRKKTKKVKKRGRKVNRSKAWYNNKTKVVIKTRSATTQKEGTARILKAKTLNTKAIKTLERKTTLFLWVVKEAKILRVETMKNPSKTKTARIFANLTTQNRRPAKRRLKRKLTPMITLKILAKKSQEFNRKVSNRKKKKIISRKETQQKPSYKKGKQKNCRPMKKQNSWRLKRMISNKNS